MWNVLTIWVAWQQTVQDEDKSRIAMTKAEFDKKKTLSAANWT
jgi:hypothetical protein